MPTATTGRVAAGDLKLQQVPEAPLLSRLVTVPDRTPLPTGELYRFLTDQGRFHQHKITARANDPEHEILTLAVLSYPEHHNGVIQFQERAFATPHLSVAQWLDREIRDSNAGIIRHVGIARDTAQMRLRCTLCDKVVLNSSAGIADLQLHMLEAHPDEVVPPPAEDSADE